MSRSSNRRKNRNDEEVDLKFIVQDDDVDIPSQIAATPTAAGAASQYDDDDDDANGGLTFTQQCTQEKSQAFPVAKANERMNLGNLTEEQRQKVIVDTSRLVLFRALSGEPIDRLKCAKLAGFPSNASRITSAVWEQVQLNLENVFGVKLVKPPEFMKLAKKYDDRFYCINAIQEDESGEHSKAIHSVHSNAAVEKGLLMVILAFCFCKGSPRPQKPTTMRWITDIDLYRLLHGLDENLPMDPPSVTERKVSSTVMSSQMTIVDGRTPQVDILMDKVSAVESVCAICGCCCSVIYVLDCCSSFSLDLTRFVFFRHSRCPSLDFPVRRHGLLVERKGAFHKGRQRLYALRHGTSCGPRDWSSSSHLLLLRNSRRTA